MDVRTMLSDERELIKYEGYFYHGCLVQYGCHGCLDWTWMYSSSINLKNACLTFLSLTDIQPIIACCQKPNNTSVLF